MKPLLLILACTGLLATLGGCAVYTPAGSVVVDPPGPYVVPAGHGDDQGEDEDGGGRGRGGFCPPGQAKKGNC